MNCETTSSAAIFETANERQSARMQDPRRRAERKPRFARPDLQYGHDFVLANDHVEPVQFNCTAWYVNMLTCTQELLRGSHLLSPLRGFCLCGGNSPWASPTAIRCHRFAAESAFTRGYPPRRTTVSRRLLREKKTIRETAKPRPMNEWKQMQDSALRVLQPSLV